MSEQDISDLHDIINHLPRSLSDKNLIFRYDDFFQLCEITYNDKIEMHSFLDLLLKEMDIYINVDLEPIVVYKRDKQIMFVTSYEKLKKEAN